MSSEARRSPWREPVLWTGLLAVLGFTLIVDPSASPMPDEPDYLRLGRSLAAGEGYVWGEHPAVKRAPGYPAFLASVFVLFGPEATGLARALQGLIFVVVLGLCLPPLLGGLGVEDPRLRRVGLGLVVLNPLFLWSATRLYPTVLCTTLVTGLGWAWLRSSWRRGILAGLLMAGLVHLRPAYVLLPVFAVLLQTVLRVPGLNKRALLPVFVFVLAVTPWALRTSILTGRPSVMAVSGFGNNLLYGAFEYRDLSLGMQRFLGRASQGDAKPGLRPANDIRPQAFFDAQAKILASAPGEPNSPRWFATLDEMRAERGWEELRTHPGAWAVATAIRSVKLWVGVFQQGWPRPVLLVARLFALVLFALGLFGVLVMFRERRARLFLLAPVFYLALIHPPLHTEGRYSYPARPLALAPVLLGGRHVMRSRRAEADE
ncbi:MAG: hypothetical protein AAF627_19575 [Myxococcota bacterium]